MDDLFDKQLRPIEGSNPQQFMTRYIPFLDKQLPPLHDPVLELDPRMVFCAPTDHNQLNPCHNPQFSHPQRRDQVWPDAHAHNRHKYTKKTAQPVAHTEQTHRTEERRVGKESVRTTKSRG